MFEKMRAGAAIAREVAATRELERHAVDNRVKTGFQSLLQYAAKPDHVKQTYPIRFFPPWVTENVFVTPPHQNSGVSVQAHVYYRRNKTSPSEAFFEIKKDETRLFSIHGTLTPEGGVRECLLNDATHRPVSITELEDKHFTIIRSGNPVVVTGRKAIDAFEAITSQL